MPRVAPLISLTTKGREALERMARSPSTPQALASRARMVLAADQGMSNQRIAAEMGVIPSTVGKWRSRYATFGIAGLRDSGRRGRPPKYDAKVWKEFRGLLRRPPPDSKQRWTVRDLARQLGLPRSTVHDMLLLELGRLRRKPPAARYPFGTRR